MSLDCVIYYAFYSILFRGGDVFSRTWCVLFMLSVRLQINHKNSHPGKWQSGKRLSGKKTIRGGGVTIRETTVNRRPPHSSWQPQRSDNLYYICLLSCCLDGEIYECESDYKSLAFSTAKFFWGSLMVNPALGNTTPNQGRSTSQTDRRTDGRLNIGLCGKK